MSKEQIRKVIGKMEKENKLKPLLKKGQGDINQLKEEVWKLIYKFTEPDIMGEMKPEYDRIFTRYKAFK